MMVMMVAVGWGYQEGGGKESGICKESYDAELQAVGTGSEWQQPLPTAVIHRRQDVL